MAMFRAVAMSMWRIVAILVVAVAVAVPDKLLKQMILQEQVLPSPLSLASIIQRWMAIIWKEVSQSNSHLRRNIEFQVSNQYVYTYQTAQDL